MWVEETQTGLIELRVAQGKLHYTASGIYACNTVKLNKIAEGKSLCVFFLDICLIPVTDYLRFARGGDIYSMRMGWVFHPALFVCLFRVISCIAVRGILQSIGLRGNYNK